MTSDNSQLVTDLLKIITMYLLIPGEPALSGEDLNVIRDARRVAKQHLKRT